MNLVDLHMHTTYSDGQASPQELLEAAKQKGLRTVAITDHETAQGNRDGQSIARQLGIELIPAIEITVSWQGYTGHGGGPDIDILGYFIDLESETLQQHEAEALEVYTARAARVCEGLRRNGHEVYVEDVLEISPSYPGYLALVEALLQRGGLDSRGLAGSKIEPFWNSAGTPLQMADAITRVHDMGGVAVLAHPAIIRRDDLEPLNERGMAQLVEMGLDGIEVLHYRNNDQQRRYFDLLARMFKLPVSGGSDEHRGPGRFKSLGTEAVTPDMVEALRTLKLQKYR